jgi:hypothetical protein
MLVAGIPQNSAPPPPEYVFAQVTVRQQVIIRVPRRSQANAEGASQLRWRETDGPRCVSIRQIAGAMPGGDSVDLVLNDNRRVRAHLGKRCAGLDYYRGMYVAPNPDGQICAERDAIRSRMGGQCEIGHFSLLQAVRP